MQRISAAPRAPAASRSTSETRAAAFLPGLIFVVAVTLLVELLARAGWLSSYFPPPSAILVALGQGLANGEITSQVGITLYTFAEGLVLASVLAITVGVLMGAFPIVYDALKTIVEFLRPIPSVAMIPLAILFLGLGAPMRVAVITYASFWPLLISTLYGVRAVDPVALDTARNFGVPPYEALYRVTLPAALVSIATGLRVSASIALVVTVTTELVAGNSGLGFYVSQMEQANRLPSMYAGILLTGILGYLINLIFFALERRVVFWSPSARGAVQ
ncbi:MAG TPA: ABC transporter permease [Candidatus Elarobacter sp.]|jgi:ABC-type nitrate/sulfonate/bicarbonate transport system permease component|nr:ABC transporter permease [Candidatus Elarobacter sp.]